MNRFVGAAFIVAGTTIGAGMLALPIAGAPLGVLTSLLLLSGMWGVMYYASLVTL
jgi:tyrosine-specific transport protein